MAEGQQGRQLPIGYWLKRVDQLLTERSNAALAERGFTRLRWQLLNTIAEAGTLQRGELHASLRPFAAPPELDDLAAGLIKAGWVAKESGGAALTITDSGRAEHGQLLRIQQAVRDRALAGVSDEDYATMVAVLQRVAGNLG